MVSWSLTHPSEIAVYLVLGVIAGICGLVYVRSVHGAEAWFHRLSLRPELKAALGGLAVGLIGLVAPRVLGTGIESMNAALAGQLTLGALLLALVCKLIATSFTLGSGSPGGSFFPAVFLGAMLGGAFGHVAQALLPGIVSGADAYAVSARAKLRGKPQLGTLGSGNHFLEVQYVDEIFDTTTASRFNLSEGKIVLLIHTGSRGLGHQVCTDYVSQLDEAMRRYDLYVPDRQLACAPIHSPEGQRYLKAMAAAANFAWTNRQCIAHSARGAFKRIFGEGTTMPVIYDVAHNIAKLETHTVDGKQKRVLVHRKGATRAFPGQPVFIPGSMGTASYFLLGQQGSMRETFGSACHGAGRVMSRTAAKKLVTLK